MYKKLCFLTSFLLVLAFSNSAWALATEGYIDDPNYNLSFEYDVNGEQIYCKVTYLDTVMAWNDNEVDWATVEIDCEDACDVAGCECKDDNSTDGLTRLTMGQMGAEPNLIVWQSLDPNYDANVIIRENYQYKLTYDTFKWEDNTLKVYMYYGNIPDNNSEDADVNVIVEDEPAVASDSYEYQTFTLDFVSQGGQAYLGKRLGIRFSQEGYGWHWIDNVRIRFRFVSSAYEPSPPDEAVDVPTDVNLAWSPGVFTQDTNGHEVYFGSDWDAVNDANSSDTSGIYRGAQDRDSNSYDPTPGANTLVLGRTYYWRIDEVNENYSPSGPNDPPVPPDNRWKGDIWSFTVTGYATNPNPSDGATDVPKNVILRWTAGTAALYHDVYFGSTEAEVTNATTDSTDIYQGRLSLGTEQYDAGTNENPQVSEQYFWRIDEVNTVTVKGNVWDFIVADYILVDGFDFYSNNTELLNVWGQAGGGFISVNTDANYVVDGKSMMLEYYNTKSPYYSEATRTYSSSQNWSYAGNGVTLLEIDFIGDMNNAPDPPMYVKLSDGTKTVQVNPGPNDVTKESVQTWQIPLSDFNDGGVTLSNITTITLGIGDGANEGGPPDEEGTLYFDDIRLHPPRCVLEYAPTGDFTGDCSVDWNDVNVMATDWLLTDGLATTETRDANLLGFTGDPCWTTGHINGALKFDGADSVANVNDPRLTGLTKMSITAWVSQTVDNDYVTIVRSKEPTCGDDQVELGIYGKAYGGPDGLGYDWSCGTEEWQFDAGLDVPTDGTWTFCAIVVEPNSGTLYMRPAGGTLNSGMNAVAHEPVDSFGISFQIGRAFDGAIDDVRIYDYNLSWVDINNLAYQTAPDPNPWPVYWYKFDESSGKSAADSGYGTSVYRPVPSKANLTDPEAKFQRSVNFRDYSIFADDWLNVVYWPEP